MIYWFRTSSSGAQTMRQPAPEARAAHQAARRGRPRVAADAGEGTSPAKGGSAGHRRLSLGMRAAPALSRRALVLGVVGAAMIATAWAGQPAPDEDALTLPPEISRSGGEPGGVVILWPRVIPRSDSPEVRQDALFIQQQLKAAVERALPGRPIDVRPEPERVCPRAGCDGVAVGALLAHKEGGCAVVATVSAAGPSEARLLHMAGKMKLDTNVAPFREAPEDYLTIWDFDRCVDLSPSMAVRMAALESALRDADPTAPKAVRIGGR